MPQPELSQLELIQNTPSAISVYLGVRKVRVDLLVGPIGQDHFTRHDGSTSFTTNRQLLLERSIDSTFGVVYTRFTEEKPQPIEEKPRRSGFRCASGSQAILYISGVDPSLLYFEAVPELESAENAVEPPPVDVVRDEGEFERPYGFLVPGRPSRWDTFTHRDVLSGIAGMDRVVIFSALSPVRGGRQIQ